MWKRYFAVFVASSSIAFVAFVALSLFASATQAATDVSDSLPQNVISGLESGILKYTNEDRDRIGVPDLQEDPDVDRSAREYSKEMVRTGNFSHTMADGTTFAQRMDHEALCGSETCTETDENIYEIDFQGLRYFVSSVASSSQIDRIAKQIVEGWLASPGHRRNIEDPLLESIGVGVAVSDRGALYATQDFIRQTPLTEKQFQQLESIPHTEEPAEPTSMSSSNPMPPMPPGAAQSLPPDPVQ